MVEISATTLLQLGIAIALAFIIPTFVQQAQSKSSEETVSQSKKKSKRKKNTSGAQSVGALSSTVASTPQSPSNASSTPTSSLSSSVENVSALEPVRSAPKKSKNKSKVKPSAPLSSDQDFPSLKPTDPSNTAVASQNSYASAAATSSSSTPKPLAERLLPKVPKTRVDDMLDDDQKDNTRLARVMRIGTDPEDTVNDDGPTTGTSEEDGWTKIPSTMKQTPKSTPSNAAPSFASKNSFAVPSSSSTETLTKKQRQNQAKKQKEKEAKEANKAEQDLRLRQHQRALESTRINEYYDKGPGRKGKAGKETSGGMRATVNDAGQLVWE